MTARTILVIDDDDELRTLLVEQLEAEGDFNIFQEDRALSGLERVKQINKGGNIDLIIMDVGMPDLDGREAVKKLRQDGFNAPIIMLTGHDTDKDTILGFDAGANDYIVKPFRFAVLMARIRAQLRQHEQSEDATFQIGSYLFRPGKKTLEDHDGTKILLTVKEAAIIKYLYRAGGEVVSRDTLLEEVWGYNSGVTTHTLETHIYRLRQKIEKRPSTAKILITDSGGYRLAP